jgi:hypothetical protein
MLGAAWRTLSLSDATLRLETPCETPRGEGTPPAGSPRCWRQRDESEGAPPALVAVSAWAYVTRSIRRQRIDEGCVMIEAIVRQTAVSISHAELLKQASAPDRALVERTTIHRHLLRPEA